MPHRSRCINLRTNLSVVLTDARFPRPPPRKILSIQTDDPAVYHGDVSGALIDKVVAGEVREVTLRGVKTAPASLTRAFFQALDSQPASPDSPTKVRMCIFRI